MILKLLTLALTIFPKGKVVFGQDSCEDGCPTFRLSGFMVSLGSESHTIRSRPNDGEVTVRGPGLVWSGEKLRGSPGHWHDISATSGPPFCVAATALSKSKSCGPEQYLEVRTDSPSSWILDCGHTSCGCNIQRMIFVRIPVDEAVTVYWWPGDTSGARIIGPGMWNILGVNEGARHQWHDIRVQPPLGGKKCGLVSNSLGKNYACTQASDDKSSIYIQSSNASGWAPSYWAFGCEKAPTEPPKVTVYTIPNDPVIPEPETSTPETIRPPPTGPEQITGAPDCATDGTPRGHCVLYEYCSKLDTALSVMIFHNFVERYGCGKVKDGKTGICFTECSGFRASGFMVALGDSPHTLKWRSEDNASLTLRGPGLPWVGEKLNAPSVAWHEIVTTGGRPRNCVVAPALRADRSCGPEQYLEVKTETPASWELNCDNSSCGCYTQRLISLRLPLGETNSLSWWPGTATGLRIVAPGLSKILQLDEAARHRWHDLTIQPEHNGTSCSFASISLGKTLACNLEVTSLSTIYIQGSNAKGWTPSYWSFGCTDVPQVCLETTKDHNSPTYLASTTKHRTQKIQW
ncbi:uncharacterized protein LOC119587429 [Penaeus monodon]|uniref:uncharacterized protein LOC119587429 n=1 Tax=Penaeus monodon TaxID=6687 RepID=UPI0018A7DE5B|nr:uncharacterized protein LOC119587429 [Penaeus monodon]